MYTVTYSYYNYPAKTKVFDTYKAAKGFFYTIMRQRGVKTVNLECN